VDPRQNWIHESGFEFVHWMNGRFHWIFGTTIFTTGTKQLNNLVHSLQQLGFLLITLWISIYRYSVYKILVYLTVTSGLTTNTHTHPFNGPFSGTTQVSRYQKLGKTNLDFTEARDSDISWAICKSAPRSRQTTTPAPHHSVFYRPDALPADQPTASKHWRTVVWPNYKILC